VAWSARREGSVNVEERRARATLSRISEPGDVALGAEVRRLGAACVLDAIAAGRSGLRGEPHYRVRLPTAEPDADLARCARLGGRLVVPGDSEWPAPLNALGDGAPAALWVRGPENLAAAVQRSVAVVGSRTATAYGDHMTGDLAVGLAERSWTVVSGGAYGIDAAAHRGALAMGGLTVAVLACGVDVTYPRGHDALFARVLDQGLLVSELPPGCTPTRYRFLKRNRLIAALARGTVVVEAALRSGARSTAREAAELGRHVMAVPGPVTSPMSAGCHELIRAGATLVTDAAEVIELVGAIGEDLAPFKQGDVTPFDDLDELTARVFEAMPLRGVAEVGRLATVSGLATSVVVARLGILDALGLAESTQGRWRLTSLARGARAGEHGGRGARGQAALPGV